MKQEDKSFLEKLNSKWITPIFAIITIIYGGLFKMYSDRLETQTNNLNNIQTQLDIKLKKQEFENKLKLTLYEEVKDAIVKDNPMIQGATLLIINEMLKEDSTFREKLKTILFASSNSKDLIAIQEKIDMFSSEQNEMLQNAFKIDVFYLEDISKESMQKAKIIVSSLKAKYPQYKIRLRLLPKEVNAQIGYRISSNQIRFEPNESNIAKDVLKLISENRILVSELPKLYKVNNKTPGYISVFVKNI